MNRQLTISLPDEIFHEVQKLAQLSNCEISDVLTETLKVFLPLLTLQSRFNEPIDTLSNEFVSTHKHPIK